MIKSKKTLKIIALSAIASIFFTSIISSQTTFAANTNRLTNQSVLSYIYSDKSSSKEKSEFIKNNKQSEKSIKLNEFNLYEKIDNSLGISLAQNNSMVKKYIDSIKYLNLKSDSELKELGYSTSRINLLRKAKTTLTNTILSELGSTLTLTSRLDGYFHDTQYTPQTPKFKTLVYVAYDWNWSETPIVLNNDGLAIAWSSNSQSNLQLYASINELNYFSVADGSLIKTVNYPAQVLNSENILKNGFYCTFPFQLDSQTRFKKKNALSGDSMNVLVSNDSYIDSFNINVIYGHSLNSTNPSFLITNSGLQASPSYSSVSNLYSKSDNFNLSDYTGNNF